MSLSLAHNASSSTFLAHLLYTHFSLFLWCRKSDKKAEEAPVGSTSPAHAPRKVLRKLNTITSSFRLTNEAEVLSSLSLLLLSFIIVSVICYSFIIIIFIILSSIGSIFSIYRYSSDALLPQHLLLSLLSVFLHHQHHYDTYCFHHH